MFKSDRATQYFRETASRFHRSSMELLSSAAVCFISSAFSKKDQRDYATVMAELREIVTEEGLKMAQMYKYIGLARQLVVDLVKKHPLMDGPIHDVLDARSPGNATTVIVDYLKSNEVETLDKLGAWLGGRYQRSEDAPNGRAPRTPTGDEEEVEITTTRGRKPLPATTTAAEVITAVTEDETVAETVAEAVSDIDVFTNLVNQITDRSTLAQMITVLEERLEALPKRGRTRRGRQNGERIAA